MDILDRPGRGRIQAHPPLSPAALAILLALAEGEKHGYGIMLETSEASGGAVRLGPGTLYRSLGQLLGSGMIGESDQRRDPALDDQRRRYYQLTEPGRMILRAEVARLERLVGRAGARGLLGAHS